MAGSAMNYYHWLGIEAEQFEQYEIEDHSGGGFTATLIEADGFITVHPPINLTR